MMERRSQESDGSVRVDLLEPPNDPFRARSKTLWEPSSAPVPSAATSGFDMDSVYQFEKNNGSEGFGLDSGRASAGSDIASATEDSAKPWWKVW